MTTAATKQIVEKFESNSGVRIYRIPLEVFTGFVGYSYVLLGAGVPTLIDTGSGIGRSNDDLLEGIAAIKNDFGENVTVTDIERIIMTHGHIDHFGGVAYMVEATNSAKVGIHPLDKRILTNYEERRIVATKDLMIFLERAGVSSEHLPKLIEMYNWSKQHVKSVKVDFMVEEGQVLDGMEFYHVPGHCSGQVAIRLGDVMLTADHVLSCTSPHIAAESITNWTGLAHYRESLRKIRKIEGIRLGLGGHEDPIDNVYGRIDVLQDRIDEKLRMMLDMIRDAGKPLSISDVSKLRYREKHGFDVLLALQEAGAYVEYLYDRGYLGVANLHEIETEPNPALLYHVLD